MSSLLKFIHRKCERLRGETRVRFQAGHGCCAAQDCLLISVDSNTIEMTSSTPHGGDVTDAMPAVTSSGEAAGDAIEAESTAPPSCDTTDAVIAEDVPPVVDVVAEPESVVKPPEQCEVQSAEQTPTPSVTMLQSEQSGASISDAEPYDIFLIASDDDQEKATKLADILLRFSKSLCNYDLRIHPELDLGGNKLEHLRSGLARSRCRFIFIDDGFREDDLVKFGTDAALMEMIERGDQSIVPVKAHAGIGTPSLLRMFRALEVRKLLNGKRLDDVDLCSLAETDVRPSEIKNIVKMVTKSDPGSSSKPSSAEQSPRMTSQHSEVLRKHFSDLANRIDPDQGLLGRLLSADVIGDREMENIRAEKTTYDRSECLLKLLMRKSKGDYMKFVDVLRDVNQSHVADILCCSSVDR